MSRFVSKGERSLQPQDKPVPHGVPACFHQLFAK